MSKLEEVTEMALKLNPLEKAKLIEILFESYGERQRKEIDTAWAKEIDDRLDALESGEIKSRPIEEVLNRDWLGCMRGSGEILGDVVSPVLDPTDL